MQRTGQQRSPGRMLMVFLRKSLLPPEPGLVRRSRRMAQRQTPSPGSRSLGWRGDTLCSPSPTPLQCQRQFTWGQVASLTRHCCPARRWTRVSGCCNKPHRRVAQTTEMLVLVTLEAGDQRVSRVGPIEAFLLDLQTAVFSLSSRGRVSGSQSPLLIRPPVTLHWGTP